MKKKRLFVIKYILIFAVMLQALTGGGLSSAVVFASENTEISGTITVNLHKSESIMAPYIKEFEEKYPKVRVEYKCLKNYETTINEKIDNGECPDVFFIPSNLSYDSYTKYLAPLGNIEEYNQKYNYIDKAATRESIVYGIPSFTYMDGIIYNKKVFEEAGIASMPKSIEDFEYDCSLIKNYTEATPLYTNYNDRWALTYWETFPFIEMHGNVGYRYNDYIYAKNPFNDGESHYQVYQLLYNLVQKGYTEPIGQGTYAQASADLRDGKIATMVMGSWAFKEIQDGGDNGDDLGFMPFPTNVDGKQYVTVLGDYCYGVKKNSKNIEAAKAFVYFMIDESGYAVDTGNISVLKTDPYADFINQMNQVTMLTETVAANQAYSLLDSLQKYISPGSMDEVARIIDSAAGRSNESFDDIMKDWNVKWEKGRPISYGIETSTYDNDQVDISNAEIYISESEQEYLDKNPTLKVGYLSYFAPFSYEIDGERTGMVFDILDIISEKTGIEMEYVAYTSPKAALEGLDKNEVQMVAGLSSDKSSGIKYSKSFYDVLNVYLCREGIDVTNLDSYPAAVDMGEVNEKITSLENTVNAANLSECFELLNTGKASYTIANSATAGYYLKDKECENIETVPTSFYSNLSMAFNESADSALVALVNKCIYTISSEKLQGTLLQYSIPPEKELNYERLLKKNPAFIIRIVTSFFGVIILAILIILIFRIRNNKRLAMEMKKHELLSELADEYIFEIDYKKMVIRFDPKFKEYMGFPEIYSKECDESVQLRCEEFNNQLERVIENTELQDNAFKLTMITGEKNWFRMMLHIINDAKGRPEYAVGKIMNVQKEVEVIRTYQSKAQTDVLTEIMNRRGFEQAIPELASRVLYIVTDIDDFKAVNDSLGHSGGDAVLKEMARTMTAMLGDDAVVARFGGDEFIALIENIGLEDAEKRIKAFVEAMDQTFEYEGCPHNISISVGAVYSEDEVKVAEFFDKADGVLYEKKKNGKNGYILKVNS